LFACRKCPSQKDAELIPYTKARGGTVLFDGQFMLPRVSPVLDCHEGNAFSFALFEMKRGAYQNIDEKYGVRTILRFLS